jgi:hypothetical protein
MSNQGDWLPASRIGIPAMANEKIKDEQLSQFQNSVSFGTASIINYE